jgi:hypothetical protein
MLPWLIALVYRFTVSGIERAKLPVESRVHFHAAVRREAGPADRGHHFGGACLTDGLVFTALQYTGKL